MIFKIRYIKLGGHVHCTLFVADGHGKTLSCAGNLCVGETELEPMQKAMTGVHFEDAAKVEANHVA